MKAKLTVSKKPLSVYITEFGAKLYASAKAVHAAAKIYSDAIDAYGDEAAKEFHKAYLAVSGTTWDRLRIIGRGCAVPETLFLSDRIASRIERLPIEEQREMLGGKNTLEVVTSRGKVVRKPIADLTASEEEVLFTSTGRKRTIDEMRRHWAERHQRKNSAAAYEVRGNVLVVLRACRIGKEELAKILEGMK